MSESPNIKSIEDLDPPGRKVAEEAEEVTEPNIENEHHSKEQNVLKELKYARWLHQKKIQTVWLKQQEKKDKISQLQITLEKITLLLQESTARIAEMGQGPAEAVWLQQEKAEPVIPLQQNQEKSVRWLQRELAQSTQRLQEELEQFKERLKQEPEISLQRFKLEVEDTTKKLQSALNRIKEKNQQGNAGRTQIEMETDIVRLQRMKSENILQSEQEAAKEDMGQQGQAVPAIRLREAGAATCLQQEQAQPVILKQEQDGSAQRLQQEQDGSAQRLQQEQDGSAQRLQQEQDGSAQRLQQEQAETAQRPQHELEPMIRLLHTKFLDDTKEMVRGAGTQIAVFQERKQSSDYNYKSMINVSVTPAVSRT